MLIDGSRNLWFQTLRRRAGLLRWPSRRELAPREPHAVPRQNLTDGLHASKFGGCKRQDSPAKRTPRTNGKFSRRCASHGVREILEIAIAHSVRCRSVWWWWPVLLVGRPGIDISVGMESSTVAVRSLCVHFCKNLSEPRCARSLRISRFGVAFRTGI